MSSCIFCKIAKREVPAEIIYENGEIIAFNDVNPQSPVHILIIPKKHIQDLTKIEGDDFILMGKIFKVIKTIAEEKKFQNGFRVVINTKESAGQSVFHLHIHLMAGRNFHWPPG
ncbi:MAG: histidine triad nucleotide-binding protein [Acidobacteria bacterium]|nr:histidine triad nucleotide-binding protein [Acidobacteriota bacterium]